MGFDERERERECVCVICIAVYICEREIINVRLTKSLLK